jgi:hypothetical protein
MNYVIFYLGTVLISFFLNCEIEKGWKEIKVFQTNQKQVEEILGKPIRNEGKVTYETDEALVHVTYSGAPCSDKPKYDLPKETVLWYVVVLKKDKSIKNLRWQKDLYEIVEDTHELGYVYYTNKKDGVRVTTKIYTDKREEVVDIGYESTPELTSKFACK